MGTILREDDFEIGMFLTGHSYVWDEDEYFDEDMPVFLTFSTKGPPEDPTKKYNGKIYRLKGVNLPYIAIESLNPADAFQGGGMAVATGVGIAHDVIFSAVGSTTCVVDVRQYKFTKITPEFAKAALGDII